MELTQVWKNVGEFDAITTNSPSIQYNNTKTADVEDLSIKLSFCKKDKNRKILLGG